MLSLSQLLTLSSNSRSSFRLSYRIDAISSHEVSDKGEDYFNVTAIVLGGKEPRKANIKMYSDTISAGALVKVSCTCTYFKALLAVGLKAADSTDVDIDRRDLPKQLHDVQKPGLCPHLITLAEAMLSNSNTELSRAEKRAEVVNVSQKIRRLT